MKKLLLFFLLACIVNDTAIAGPYQEVQLTNRDFTIQHTMDRSNSSPEITLFKDIAGYSLGTYNQPTSTISFLCYDATDYSNGACDSRSASVQVVGITDIVLQFTEKRSKVKYNLTLQGYKNYLWEKFNDSEDSKLNSYYYKMVAGGNAYSPEGVKMNLYIPPGEINKLPFGGIWEATLKLRVTHWNANRFVWTFNISINLTDKNNIQVWVPGFHSDPRVDLNLRPEGNGRYTGTNMLDMCFYDGYSTNSNSMEIKLQDGSGVSSGNTYYLNKTDAPSERLPYSVTLLLGGRRFKPENGMSFSINDSAVLETNWNRITAVSMPEINVPVLCWPAQLLFSADVSNPAAGGYSGNIRITFTPSSVNL